MNVEISQKIPSITINKFNKGENFMIIDEIKKDNVQAMKDKNALARAI